MEVDEETQSEELNELSTLSSMKIRTHRILEAKRKNSVLEKQNTSQKLLQRRLEALKMKKAEDVASGNNIVACTDDVEEDCNDVSNYDMGVEDSEALAAGQTQTLL